MSASETLSYGCCDCGVAGSSPDYKHWPGCPNLQARNGEGLSLLDVPGPAGDSVSAVQPLYSAEELNADLFAQWEDEFKPLLGSTARWQGFCYLMRDQLARERPVILETGTLREPGNWKGDGQSTRLWQWVAEHKTGCVVSVDLDLKACELARRECPKVHVICQDSVAFLRGFMPFAVTLLYLDSMVHGPTNVDLWMHQVAELSAIWERLPSGCLIASDDNAGSEAGKPVLTRRLFETLGIEPVLDSYIVIWRKP